MLLAVVKTGSSVVFRSVPGKEHVLFMAMHERSDDLSELENISNSFIDIPNQNFPLIITF